MSEYISREEAVDAGYLSDWYISSVDDEPPVWTDAHIDELLNDFIVIPKDTKGKHGKFVPFTDTERYETFKDGGIPFDGRCSVCDSCLFNTDKYCGGCGAKMIKDGEQND